MRSRDRRPIDRIEVIIDRVRHRKSRFVDTGGSGEQAGGVIDDQDVTVRVNCLNGLLRIDQVFWIASVQVISVNRLVIGNIDSVAINVTFGRKPSGWVLKANRTEPLLGIEIEPLNLRDRVPKNVPDTFVLNYARH